MKTEHEMYLAFYADFRKRKAGIWEACPALITELGLETIWSKAFYSYLDSKHVDRYTLSLQKRRSIRMNSFAYAA